MVCGTNYLGARAGTGCSLLSFTLLYFADKCVHHARSVVMLYTLCPLNGYCVVNNTCERVYCVLYCQAVM